MPKVIDNTDKGMCANCGKDPLIDSLLVRERIAHGLAGHKHMGGSWLCEYCENKLMRLKAEANWAFGLPIIKERWKNGKLVRGWEGPP